MRKYYTEWDEWEPRKLPERVRGSLAYALAGILTSALLALSQAPESLAAFGEHFCQIASLVIFAGLLGLALTQLVHGSGGTP